MADGSPAAPAAPATPAAAPATPPATPAAAAPAAPATPPATPPAAPATPDPAQGLARAAQTPPATPPATPATPDPTAPQAFHPEGLPDAYKGANDRETIERMWKDLAAAPKPPANATDYKLELPKDLVGVIDPANDKVLPIFQEVAKSLGMSQEQYQGAIVGLYQGMAKAGMIGKAVDVSGEYAALGEGKPDRASQIQAGRERAANVADRIDGMVTREMLSKELGETLIGGLASAKMIMAVEQILGMIPGEHGVQPRGRPTSGAKSRAEVERMMMDPRYDARGPKFDQAYLEEVNRLFALVS